MNHPDKKNACSDCGPNANRRDFLKTSAVAAGALGAGLSLPRIVLADDAPKKTPETLVKVLYDTLSDTQKKDICFTWDYTEQDRGLLRTRVANNWQITDPHIGSDYFNKDQQQIIREIFEGMYNPDWVKRIDKQLEDDGGGYGVEQSIAIFGTPGEDKFEFVMTGRHLTLRCDGNSTEHVAFGGPIFYGHAADGFNEGPTHPGNVFWPQAVEANKVYQLLDEKQRKAALVAKQPREQDSGFKGTGAKFTGLPMSELSSDQREAAQNVLKKLLEPYRTSDQDEALACLKTMGGLDACSLSFYKEGDIAEDGTWDCWRIEGPSFVWYFRGSPHVHVWVNIGDDPSIKLNA